MAAWLGPDPDEHAQVDEEPFGQIRDDSDHVPGGRQVEFQPAPMPPKLRTVTLQRWQRLVGLARESVDDLHDKVDIKKIEQITHKLTNHKSMLHVLAQESF